MILPLAAAALALACPHDASLGTVTYARGAALHAFSFADCRDRAIGKAKPWTWPSPLRSRAGATAKIATARAAGARFGTQEILVDGRPVLRVREDYSRAPGGNPGPLGLFGWSPDGRWLLFYIDPQGAASIAADGLSLRALRIVDGHVKVLPRMLLNPDYATWCGSTLVLAAGTDRLATHHKQLLALTPPKWKPRQLWHAPKRAFGSVACAPGGRSVAVLSQPDSSDANFFGTRWQLWQVSMDGKRRLLDTPPAGFADESPLWSPNGDGLLFVRERRGVGSAYLLRTKGLSDRLFGLGYSLGYYGHHAWWLGASWHA